MAAPKKEKVAKTGAAVRNAPVITYGLTGTFRLTITQEMLGTASSDPDVHDIYISAKAQDAGLQLEETSAIAKPKSEEEILEHVGKTVFARDSNGTPILWDYQIRGFLKASFSTLSKIPGTAESQMKAFLKFVDTSVFVYPRKIRICGWEDAGIGECQRPLRANTAQGPRVALANSETVPPGSFIEIKVLVLMPDGLNHIRNALDYGMFHGLGQWRNSGKGTFIWDELEDTGPDDIHQFGLSPEDGAGVTLQEQIKIRHLQAIAVARDKAARKAAGEAAKKAAEAAATPAV